MPLSWPRKSDAWNRVANLVEFPGEDSDTLAPVGCAISEQALANHFGGDAGDVLNLLAAFRRYRAVIEHVASRKYDADGKPDLVVLQSQDFPSRAALAVPGEIAIERPPTSSRSTH